MIGNEVADGVVDKSSTKFDAKTIECIFSRMLKLVSCAAISFRYFLFGQLLWYAAVLYMHDKLPYSSAENDGKPNRHAVHDILSQPQLPKIIILGTFSPELES